MDTLDYLFKLIQFDMQQIQNYRLEIIYVSVTIVAASFALSAFVYHRDNELDARSKNLLLILSNCCLLAILIITASFYLDGLDASRATQELRENALKQHVNDNTVTVTAKELYPDPAGHPSGMKLWLEKFPIFLAMALIVLKTAIEWTLLGARYGEPARPDRREIHRRRLTGTVTTKLGRARRSARITRPGTR